jgi:anti-anti-sigma regulatory factor
VIGEKWARDTSPCPAGALTITTGLSRPQLNTTVCTVTGTLNTATTLVLRDALVEARRDDNTHLVIDLSTITSMDMDSAGLYTLLEARHKHNINGGGHLAVVVDSRSQAVSELHMVVLEVAFDLHHNLDDALHACAIVDANGVQSGNRGRALIEPALVPPKRAQVAAVQAPAG